MFGKKVQSKSSKCLFFVKEIDVSRTPEKLFFSCLFACVGLLGFVLINLSFTTSLGNAFKTICIIGGVVIFAIVFCAIWSIWSKEDTQMTFDEKKAHRQSVTIQRISNQFTNALKPHCRKYKLLLYEPHENGIAGLICISKWQKKQNDTFKDWRVSFTMQ